MGKDGLETLLQLEAQSAVYNIFTSGTSPGDFGAIGSCLRNVFVTREQPNRKS